MKRIGIITVGKIKTPHWRAAADEYRKRLKNYALLEERQVRDADSALPPEARKEQEGRRILTVMEGLKNSSRVICLDENGESPDSAGFSALLQGVYDMGQSPCFIIGGAYGLAAPPLAAAWRRISLSPMTFTHEMALVILLEQLYRAENIIAGTGYHH